MKCHGRLAQGKAPPLPAVTLLNDIQSLKLHFLDYPVSHRRGMRFYITFPKYIDLWFKHNPSSN